MTDTLSFSTLSDLRAATGLTTGDCAELAGYYVSGDGGGGCFTFEQLTPSSATITTIAQKSLTVSEASATTPIIITTTTNHNLSTGHSVLVSGVSTEADGSWLVKVLSSTTFELIDSAGTAAHTSGTVTNATITTSAAHDLEPGDVVMIAGVAGATGINGTWLPAGYPNPC